MNKREFNAILKSVSVRVKGKGLRISEEKARALPDGVKKQVVEHIVRYHAPVLTAFIPNNADFDMSRLIACGYLYTTKGKSGYTFRHTCEHTIQ